MFQIKRKDDIKHFFDYVLGEEGYQFNKNIKNKSEVTVELYQSEDTIYFFERNQHWRMEKVEELSEPEKYIWKHRKWINEKLKSVK